MANAAGVAVAVAVAVDAGVGAAAFAGFFFADFAFRGREGFAFLTGEGEASPWSWSTYAKRAVGSGGTPGTPRSTAPYSKPSPILSHSPLELTETAGVDDGVGSARSLVLPSTPHRFRACWHDPQGYRIGTQLRSHRRGVGAETRERGVIADRTQFVVRTHAILLELTPAPKYMQHFAAGKGPEVLPTKRAVFRRDDGLQEGGADQAQTDVRSAR